MAKGKKAGKKADASRPGKDGKSGAGKRKADGGKRAKASAEIGGVKVPKELRAFAAQAQRIAEHPIVADIVAAGLVAAAASLVKDDAGPDDAAAAKGSAKTAVKAAAGAMGREVMKNLKGAAAGGAKAALVGSVKPKS